MTRQTEFELYETVEPESTKGAAHLLATVGCSILAGSSLIAGIGTLAIGYPVVAMGLFAGSAVSCCAVGAINLCSKRAENSHTPRSSVYTQEQNNSHEIRHVSDPELPIQEVSDQDTTTDSRESDPNTHFQPTEHQSTGQPVVVILKALTFITLLALSTTANAGLYVGGGLSNIRVGNDDFQTVKEFEPRVTYKVGYYKELQDNWVLDLVTNAPFSFMAEPHERAIVYNKTTLINKNKLTYGSILLGKKIDNVVTSLSISYVKTSDKIYYNKYDKSYLTKDKKEAIALGANMKYFIDDEKSISLSCLLPNTSLDLKFSCGIGASYYFNFD